MSTISGRRKDATAVVRLSKGKGTLNVNKKNIDEYIESAVDLKQLDLYDCETFSKSLMRRYGEHNIERVENETEGFNKCEKISGKLDVQSIVGKVIEVDSDQYRREVIKMRRIEL